MIALNDPFDPGPLSGSDDADGPAVDLLAGARNGAKSGGEITLRRLRIFWAVAHSTTLTRAAKLLNVSLPTLSQQLTAFEAALGTPLFERRSNQMILTQTGEVLLRKAETVLRSAQELEDSLPQTGGPVRQSLRIAGVVSVMRVILPGAIARLSADMPLTEFDIHECAPAEIIDLLYARRVNIGLMAANSIAEVSAGFQQLPVMEDPFVLAVPESLDLSQVADASRDLSPEAQATLNNVIQFVFGSQHSARVQDWFDRMLPDNKLAARVRSFELALDLVSAGLGVCVVPALSALAGTEARAGLRLYRTTFENRRIVAMVPSQYLRVPLYADFLKKLQDTAQSIALPALQPLPPFMAGTRAAQE